MQVSRKELLDKLGNIIREHKNNNQSILYFENGEILQSYKSIIVVKLYNDSMLYLGKDWKYSSTTSKHRIAYTGINTKETEKMIKAGHAIIVPDL